MQRETLNVGNTVLGALYISILSLYAEGDHHQLSDQHTQGNNFNPLPLCRGRRLQ